MFNLHIEHQVLDYDAWKQAFDRDPIGRRRAGVVRWRVERSVNDAGYVMVDLDFESRTQAETLLQRLNELWGDVQGKIVRAPRALIAEIVEDKGP